MQDGVRKEDVKFTKIERTLSGMGGPETLSLGIAYGVSWFILYLTRITYLFPQTYRIGFPQIAIRGSPARQCADCPHGNAWIVRGSVQSSADERGSVRTRLKTVIDC